MAADAPRLPLSREKRRGGITYYLSATARRVVTGEHEDNPHGVNHEASCAAEDFLADCGDGQRCRSIVRGNFGEGVVAQIVAALEAGAETQGKGQ